MESFNHFSCIFEVPGRFPCIFIMWIAFPFYEVLNTLSSLSTLHYLLDFVFDRVVDNLGWRAGIRSVRWWFNIGGEKLLVESRVSSICSGNFIGGFLHCKSCFFPDAIVNWPGKPQLLRCTFYPHLNESENLNCIYNNPLNQCFQRNFR